MKMANLEVLFLIIGFSMVSTQSTIGIAGGFGPSLDYAKEIHDLRYMLQTLQTQNMALNAQVSAVHNTLMKQQTMSVAEICHILEEAKRKAKQAKEPVDCNDIMNLGNTQSAVYTIVPPGLPATQVYCDLESDGGGWLVFQRRIDGQEDFYRTYNEYENGFGNLTGEHYLGNKILNALTKSGQYELRIELIDYQRNMKLANYDTFIVDDATAKYKLHVDGYNGTAGDSLIFDHNGHAFSTYDSDNDGAEKINCAEKQHGGYWYSACFKSNINGKWGVPGEQGIIWGSYKDWTLYVLKRTEMKIRRKQ